MYTRLCQWAGGDPVILSKSELRARFWYPFIGGLIGAICVLTFASLSYAFTIIFDDWRIGIPLGFGFAFVVFNLYHINMLTLTTSIEDRKPGILRDKTIFFRLAVLVIIALLVSKPFESLLYSEKLTRDIEEFKREKIKEGESKVDKFYNAELVSCYEQLELIRSSGIETPRKRQLESSIAHMKEQMERKKIQVAEVVNHSDYLFRRIIIMNNKYHGCWAISVILLFLFSLPVILKRYVAFSTNYEFKKNLEDRSQIFAQYAEFRQKYKAVMIKEIGQPIEFYEPYADAPFNKERKKDERRILSEGELVKRLI